MSYDRRSAYSQRTIKKAFLDLLADRDVDDVTVKAICLTADVNRSTFYRYFDGIEDLLDKMTGDYYDSYFPAGVDYADDLTMMQMVYENQTFFRALMSRNALTGRALELTRGSVRDWEDRAHRLYGSDYPYADTQSHFISRGYAEAVRTWLDQGCPGTVEGFCHAMRDITSVSRKRSKNDLSDGS